MRRASVAFVFIAAVVAGMPARSSAISPIAPETLACAPLPSGLTHWWRGDGNANDFIGGDHGTPVGTVTYAPGLIGQAFQFGAGHVRLSQTYGGASTAEVTVMGWIKTQQSGPEAWQAILSSADSTFVHFQTADFGGSAVYTNAGFNQIPSFGSSPTGTWRHVALTVRSGEIRVYLNGGIVGQLSSSFSSITQAPQVLIGAGYNNARPFPGLVDDLQMYNRALTSTEITAAFSAGSAGFCQPQIADGDVNGLIAAILAANTNPGPDTIALAPGAKFTLTVPYTAGTGLPVITDALTITGNDATIERSQAPGTPEFRILAVHLTNPTDVLTLSALRIRNGVAASPAEGGGIRHSQGVLNLQNGARVSENRATLGGGIWSAPATTLTVTRSTIADNVADNGMPTGVGDGHGGGIYSSGNVSVVETTVSGNNARLQGGGIVSQAGGNLSVLRSTISGNSGHSPIAPTAGYAGGILNWIGSTATVANSTIANNFTNFGGGGIRNTGTLTVINSTIALNHSTQYGSGILTDANGVTTVANTLLAQNFLGRNCNFGFSGNMVSQGGNLSEDGTCAGVFTQAGDRNNTPGGLDPGGLADNGGPTRTIALMTGSAAIDSGSDARCAAAPIGNVDQRGTLRPAAVHCDIGAFELQEIPGAGIWLPKNTMLVARQGPSAAGLNGRMYVLGGASSSIDFHSIGTVAINTVEAYDPLTNTWTPAANLPFARVYTNGAAVINNKIYVQGGAGCDAPNCRESDTLFIFDPAVGPQGTWSAGPPMPARVLGGMSGAIDGRMYVLAGWSVGAPRDYLYRFDPATSTWAQLAGSSYHHVFGAGAAVGGKFYATGGESNRSILSIYDPATNTWTHETMPVGYQHHAAIAVGDWLMLAGGSQFVGGSFVSDRIVMAYDTVNRTWTTASPVASAGGPYTATSGAPIGFNGSSSSTFGRLPQGLDLVAGAAVGTGAYLAGGVQPNPSQILRSVFGMNPVQREVLTYAWDFGDGQQGTGLTPEHTYAAAGTYTATLTVTAPDGRSGTASATVTVSQNQHQAITFTSTPPTPALVGGSYLVTATGGESGNPVTFGSSSPGVCSVFGNVVQFIGVGTCVIAANQAGGGGYLPADQATQVFSVTSMPTITVPSQMVVEAVGPGGAVVTFAATASDPYSPTGAASCAPASGSTFGLGTTAVTCTGTNGFGVSASASFNVVVRDTVAPAIVAFLFPADVPSLSANPVVRFRVTDAVGVAVVTGNGASFSLYSGTATDGVWAGVVSASALQPYTVSVAARDGSLNASTRTFDSDGIHTQLDRSRIDFNVDQSAIVSNDFNNGTTSGTVSRNGLPVEAEPAGTDVHVFLTYVPPGWSNPSAGAWVCGGDPKSVWFDRSSEGAIVRCITNPTGPPSLRVRAQYANPTIEVYKDHLLCGTGGNCTVYRHRYSLRTGQTITTGSPVHADSENTEPVLVEILRINNDGTEEVIGSYEVDPGETVDSSIEQGAAGQSDRVILTVLSGEITATIGGDTVTVAEGETVTSLVEQLTQVITFNEIPNKLFGDPAFALTATASSGLPVSYSVTGACMLSGTMVTPSGTGTCTVTAAQAGNLDYLAAAPVSRTFSVWHAWSGLLQPVNAGGSSVFKLGSTVPLKFQLTGASGAVTNLQARVYVAKVSNSVVGTEVEAASTSAADSGNTFRYSDGQYVFNWGTKGLSEGTWQIRVDLLDGNPNRVVVVSLRK